MTKDPLFMKYINRDVTVSDMLGSFSRSSDSYTAKEALKALNNPPNLDEFHKELSDAVSDIIKEGPGKEFEAFVNHYMEPSLEEDVASSKVQLGENVSRMARIKDALAPWIQGFICYNLCLYIKAYGLESLKRCKICGRVFDHKGKWAVYCSDGCKSQGKAKK